MFTQLKKPSDLIYHCSRVKICASPISKPIQYYLQKKDAVDNSASFGQDKTFQICKDLAKEDKQRVAKREKPFLRPAEWNRFFDGLIKVRHRPLKSSLKAAIKLLEKTHEKQMNIGEIRDFYSKKCKKYNE